MIHLIYKNNGKQNSMILLGFNKTRVSNHSSSQSCLKVFRLWYEKDSSFGWGYLSFFFPTSVFNSSYASFPGNVSFIFLKTQVSSPLICVWESDLLACFDTLFMCTCIFFFLFSVIPSFCAFTIRQANSNQKGPRFSLLGQRVVSALTHHPFGNTPAPPGPPQPSFPIEAD